MKKTKVVSFNCQRSSEYHVFTFNGLPIQHTSEYKYLSVLLTSNGSLKSAISTLALQADKAAFSLKRKVMLLHYPKPSTIVHIYKALIRPITEYASEVWGYYKSDVLERGHRHFGKFILGLPSSACNAAVYGELGTFPLDSRKKIRMVKYWLRLSTHWDVSPLLQKAYQINISTKPSKWAQYIQNLLNEAGFSYVWENPNGIAHDSFIHELEERLSDQFQQQWATDLSVSKKLRTYKLFKKKLEYELYLNLPRHQRVQLCRLRVSAHSLRIETGRYSLPRPTPVEERLCATCGVIEDETHFLISCKFHQCKERVDMLNSASSLKNSFQHLSQLDKCVFILSSKNRQLMSFVAKFVYVNFMKRLGYCSDIFPIN